ncbi:MAG: hypothetical protein GX224_02205 [Thermoplasmatales archaeon]|nr:hypothetical protein [Thermoplasmatales archaeon]
MAKSRESISFGSVGYLAVFAGIIALAYLVIYLNAGINNKDNFTELWLDLVIGLLFLATAIVIFKNKKVGWTLYIVSLALILVKCIMDLSVNELPLMVLTLFALLYMLSDGVKSQFGI